jgi:hypothetical protein
MIDGWRTAYRLQRRLFPELAYEAIYAVPQGNIAPLVPPSQVAPRAMERVVQSKLLVAGLLTVLAAGAAALLLPEAHRLVAPDLSAGLYHATVLGGLLLLEASLLWWTGLQVLPAFLTSPILPTLETLPLEERTVERTVLLLFLRLFDLPAAVVVVATPVFVGLALGSALAGLALLPGVISVVAVALALALATGRFFVRRVQAAPGGWRPAALRWIYLVLWTLPAFAIYLYVSFGPSFVAWLAAAAAGRAPGAVDGLLATYPFPFAALPTIAAGGSLSGGPGPGPIVAVITGAVLYTLATALLLRWLPAAPRALAVDRGAARAAVPRPGALHPRSASASVLFKDLRIASRSPSYGFLVLLPLLDAVGLGLYTVVGTVGAVNAFRIAAGAVATAALLAVFFGPAIYSIELKGYAYSRSLPLTERAVVGGKTLLVSGIYLAAAGLVLLIALSLVFDPLPFAAFILAELPAVVAAALFELALLSRAARRRGLPIPNLYAGSWWAFGVGIPGVIVAGAPLALFALRSAAGPWLATGAAAALALAELGAAATFSYLVAAGGAR